VFLIKTLQALGEDPVKELSRSANGKREYDVPPSADGQKEMMRTSDHGPGLTLTSLDGLTPGKVLGLR
jgi:hypothetical protein